MTRIRGNDTILSMAAPSHRLLLRSIGIAIFLWILWSLNFRALLGHVRNADPLLLIASFGTIFAIYAVKALRWSRLTAIAGLKTSFREAWRLYNIGIFLGNITPGKLGEFGRVPYLRRAGLHAGTGTMLTILDRLLDVLLIAILAIASTGILFGRDWMLWSFLLGLGCGALGLVAWMQTHRLREEHDWLRFLKTLADPKHALVLIALTAIGWALYYLWALLLARSLGIFVAPLPLLSAITITGILSLLPIAPAGLGTRDAALLALLAPFGVLPEQSVAYALLMFVLILLSSALGGWYWLRQRQ